MTFRLADLVGRYRLVVTDALLEFVERALVEPSPASDRERIRREALDEAQKAELVIDEDGTIASRSGNVEFYRVKVALHERELDALRFEKPASRESVTLVLVDSTRVIAHQSNKPPAEFRRIA
jgi:hypothetical protein